MNLVFKGELYLCGTLPMDELRYKAYHILQALHILVCGLADTDQLPVQLDNCELPTSFAIFSRLGL